MVRDSLQQIGHPSHSFPQKVEGPSAEYLHRRHTPDNKPYYFRKLLSCDGLDCCHTTIPSYTKDLIIDFSPEAFSNNNGTKGNRDNNNGAKENYDNRICKYAFVADQEWLRNSTEVLSPGVPGMTHVPVVLNWDLLYNLDYVKALEKNIMSVIPNSTVVCNTKQSRSTRDELSLFCRCQEGYEGNPYDLHGCLAVSECDPDSKPCGRRKDVCVKHRGIYKCIEDSSHSKTLPMIVGFGTGLGVLLIIVPALAFYKFMMKRKDVKRKEKFFKRNGGLLLQKQMSPSDGASMERIKLFNAKELEKATDHFNEDRIIGQGGQGTVFKGMLADGKIVTVKRSKVVDEAKLTEFINEVLILLQINHRNVVKLLGCCLETDVPLLVYEFVPNGNLSQLIHDPHEEFTLTWEMRRRIAIEVTGALSYLHSAASFPIFHRDIKSTNILLDEMYRAKVADFGTSRSVNMDQTHLTTKVQGTFGYLDPEYFRSSQYTEKSDVYSFGVVLIELLTGEKAVHVTSSRKGRSLVTHFIDSMDEGRLCEILDNEVKKGSTEEITVAANLARRCLHLNGRERPTMKEAAMVLEGTQMLEGDSYSIELIEATSVYVSE
ncbi:Wall-associated receptor kinase-like 9 [Morus notabilis]|uniref:Wall-associated receptor kinase-like 9 n=1 Tax=Morus notabilis TaxID=981085 RepID=W9RY99_9ROSA|nr:Wall-associated receptor kinase-like 9 [Morus notabilis]